MMPFGGIASVLALTTAGLQSARSLKSAASRYSTRDTTLRRLQSELGNAEEILIALEGLLQTIASRPALDSDLSMAALLSGPIEQCSKICCDFEKVMAQFSSKSKTNFVDWTKMEFMRGDINQFMDSVARYKATISVGLGVLTMHTVRLSHQALGEYDELVKNTMYDLNLRLQRIDDKMDSLAPASDPATSSVDIDLSNEREVTKQCLKICEDAILYLESLAHRDSALLQEVPPAESTNAFQKRFEAQLLTRKTFDDNQASLVKIVTRLRERLGSVILDGDSNERLQLQKDIQISKQCLEVCQLASSEVTNQKIHIIGDVLAEGDSDHMVVTTLADMFSVGKTISKGRSAVLVGSMSDEALVQLSHDRYNSRFGTAAPNGHHAEDMAASKPEAPNVDPSSLPQRNKNRQTPPQQRIPPSSNETRKRVGDSEDMA